MIRSLSRSCQTVEQARICEEENVNRCQRSLLNADACTLFWEVCQSFDSLKGAF
jgi:hypothetical protein